MVARWPVHPRPAPLESLSSWVSRLAALYGMRVEELLDDRNLDLDGAAVPYDLDFDPPETLLVALAERTGHDLGRLWAMTLIGWSPWLFDWPFHPQVDQQQPMFDTYVRANSVLLAPGEAGDSVVAARKRWYGPWRGANWGGRVCPVCAPERGTALVWRLPLLVGCGEHGCYLEHHGKVGLARMAGEPITPRPVPEPLATMERHTHATLTTGRVELPGRSVHAGVWFRLLRSLLDEVSLALTTRHAQARATLETVWAATGLPERGGINGWRPYEHLEREVQESLLLAAATALQLAADDTITACGRLASAIQPARDQYVYDGDRPGWPDDAWREAVSRTEAAMITARTDRAVAWQLLAYLTVGCRTLARFEEQRGYLFGAGIPAGYLPSAGELGRTDLL
ncbi:TniQ protein [Kutzneria buriramensis]|uniref:TniQ protein n=1 Tax=Kutzneria buriramensis TaxID=1045776 RepID=A0A3E0GXR5_9PSEU|nr:TniQ protein [Kutzneria buriramensis]